MERGKMPTQQFPFSCPLLIHLFLPHIPTSNSATRSQWVVDRPLSASSQVPTLLCLSLHVRSKQAIPPPTLLPTWCAYRLPVHTTSSPAYHPTHTYLTSLHTTFWCCNSLSQVSPLLPCGWKKEGQEEGGRKTPYGRRRHCARMAGTAVRATTIGSPHVPAYPLLTPCPNFYHHHHHPLSCSEN